MKLLDARLRWQEIVNTTRPIQLRIAVLASFTAEPLTPYLGIALEKLSLPAEIQIGPYHQIAQECLNAESSTANFQPSILLVWPRLEELWNGQPLPLIDDPAIYLEQALELANICQQTARRWQATMIFVLPTIPEVRPLGLGDANNPTGVFATATRVRETLRSQLAGQPGVLLIDLEEVIRQCGSRQAYNDRMHYFARIPFTETLFNEVAERLAGLIQLNRQAARKLIVVDADKTLWDGIVGEDGPDGIDMTDNGTGEAYRDFQDYLLELRRSGLLLALCSKNEESDVWAVFARREMRLQREHLTAWQIGWQPKSAGINQIAATLGLGLDSVVFIDDNPAEIAEVAAALPQVACLQMPADPAHWRAAIATSPVLSRLAPTSDDLARSTYYQQEQARTQVRASAATTADYLAQLEIKIRFAAPQPADLARLTQLVNKTNQFNLNCRRRNDAELSRLIENQNFLIRLVSAQDRFGDYGLIGLFIIELAAARVELDTFLLSCRVLGRGIETAMLWQIFQQVQSRGINQVWAQLEEQPRNQPARQFFTELQCQVGISCPLAQRDLPSYITLLSAE